MMPRLLTVAMLVALLWPWPAPSDAQAQGPGPGEVPSELWEEYPLEEPRSTPRTETSERQGDRNRPAPRAIDRATSDGSDATRALLIAAGLLLLAASAIFVLALASARGVMQRYRDKRRALRGGAPGASSAADGRRPDDLDVRSTAQSTRRPSVPRPPPPTKSTQSSGPAPERDALARARARARARSGAPASTPGIQPALGYASVRPGDKGNDSLRRQQQEIDAICSRKGLDLLELVRDVEFRGGSYWKRPGLAYALEHLEAHDASCLVVSSLERLTPSAANLGTLVEWLDQRGARLVVADIDLDTGTPEGRLVAKALATVGGSERKTLMQRTRKGLEAARLAQRSAGQPAVSDPPALKQRIADMRADGMTLQAIADTLNAEGVPTLRGGALWRPSSVQAAAGYKRPRRTSPLA
jgi:DNA invertase Pin-like site-specific DNA recombinase